MKAKVLFLALCMVVSITLTGQNQSKQLMEVEVTPPKFTGIEEVLKFNNELKSNSISQYVANNFIYPETNGHSFEGTEVVQFRITQTGELSDFKVINSVGSKIDQEIIKILQTTEGMWKPGYNNGKPVSMEKEVALEIKAGETERVALKRDFDQKAKYYFTKGTDNFFEKGKLNKALKNFSNGILYRPYDQSLYYIRGLCRYELGYIEGAREDWMRLTQLGGIDMSNNFAEYNIKDLKGYDELTTVFLAEKK